MLATDLVASADERRKKSVFYESCTSDWKNDFPTLVACLKSDKDMPHTRQEAGFLLWHHALEGDDVAGLLSAGLMGACLANLDAGDVPPTERACSAGILLALVAGRDEVAEQLLRSRAPSGRPSLEVLHYHLADDTATAARHHCCRLLHLIAKQVGAAMLRCMDHQLPYLPRYLEAWGDRDAAVVTGVACTVALLVQERPELAAPVVAAGGLEVLLDVLRSHKAEAACSAAATCLTQLLTVEGAAEQLIAAGGIPVLIDLIGPPPHLAADLSNLTLEDLTGGVIVRHPPPPPPSSSSLLQNTELSAEASTRTTPYNGAAASMPASGGSGSDGGGGGTSAPPSHRASGGGDGAERQERSQGSKRTSASSGSEVEAAEGAGADRVRPPGAGPARSVSYSQSVQEGPQGSGGGSSQASSPRKLAGGGSGIGRSASPSLTSLGSSSMTVRVQLPLVIPGIHSPSAAAAAAALSGMPSPRQATRGTALGSPGGEASAVSSRRLAAAAAASPNGAAVLPPPVLPAADLESNRCGLRWILLPGLEVASLAVTCLTLIVNRPEMLAEAERRLAAHRIVAQLKAVMPAKAGAEGSGKKAGSSGAKKKKGLGLTPEQTAGLVRLMGLLKFISLMNTNRYRIAKLGAVPALLRLYGEGSDYLLRNHCQVILSNVALLAENGRALRDALVPEEFLVANPMRLTGQERAVLRLEFPDEAALAG